MGVAAASGRRRDRRLRESVRRPEYDAQQDEEHLHASTEATPAAIEMASTGPSPVSSSSIREGALQFKRRKHPPARRPIDAPSSEPSQRMPSPSPEGWKKSMEGVEIG